MTVLFIALLAMIILTIRVNLKGFNEDYLSPKSTLPIKGIFVALVFMSHLYGYTNFTLRTDLIVIKILELISQLMVTMFLFYSGYGIFESIRRKGDSYLQAFPKKRILKTWFNFALAILLFMLMNLLLKVRYPLRTNLAAFIGWEGIGNSSWYMFVILTLYIFTWLVFRKFSDDHRQALLVLTGVSVAYVLIFTYLRPSRFSNTYLCYVAGMWYSFYKYDIDRYLRERPLRYWLSLGGLALVFVLLVSIFVTLYRGHLKDIAPLAYNLLGMVFCLIVVLLTMKVRINSRILALFGKYVFWIYILQRIPMKAFEVLNMNGKPYLFTLLCLISCIILIPPVAYLSRLLNKLIWEEK